MSNTAEAVKAETPKADTKKTVKKTDLAKPEGAHKLAIIKKFSRGKNDTGSPEVQIAVLTDRINYLTKHFEQHKKDHHSRRGLLMLVGNRRRLLNYIKSTNVPTYEKLLSELGLRK